MAYLESNTPIAFANAHLLDQIGEVAFFKKDNREKLPLEWKCSKAGDKVRLHAFVSVNDVMNIDSIGEKFDIKFRLFLIWKVNLEELGFRSSLKKLSTQATSISCSGPNTTILNRSTSSQFLHFSTKCKKKRQSLRIFAATAALLTAPR